MKIIIILLVATLACVSASTDNWTQIRVKFAFSGVLEDIDAFWRLNNTMDDMLASGWSVANSNNNLGLITVCLSQKDVRFCGLYDSHGYIAGVQIALPPSDFLNKGIPYNFANFPVYEKMIINGYLYWTSTLLVVNPLVLRLGGRTSMTNLGTGLWFKYGSAYTEIPTSETVIASTTKYNKQNCLPNMGTHYFYNANENASCSDLEPWFLLVKNGSLHGVGYQVFGKTTPVDRDWYDKVSKQATEMTFPTGAKCLSDWTVKYGVISIHVYFEEKPWEIDCDQAKDSIVPIKGLSKIILDSLYSNADLQAKTRKLIRGW